MRPLRIGVNALYLIPGGVGGTEIYLRELLRALAANPSNEHARQMLEIVQQQMNTGH